MKITLKLYGKLDKYLPENASKNQTEVEIEESSSVEQALDDYGITSDQCHLVMVNGVYVKPEERAAKVLSESDNLAVWPPSTG